MKKELEISVDITPVPQKRPRVTRFGTYDPQKADKEAFKELVVVPEDHIPFDKAIHVEMIIYIPLPKSHSKKKKAELLDTYHISRGDCDNFFKIYTDALTNMNVWVDDNIIASTTIKKIWAETGNVYIKITEL